MSLPKSLTTVTAFSKILAALLFILFPLIAFRLGAAYQKNVDYIADGAKHESEEKAALKATPTPPPVSSPNRPDWNRYMGAGLDYYIDYPQTYAYGKDAENSISFEKIVAYPHRTNCRIFVDKGVSLQFPQAKIDELKQMAPGEKKIVMQKQSSLPSKFKTYERLPDTYFGAKKAMSYVNKDVWEGGEGTYQYIYIYEGMDIYIFGGLTNESKNPEDNISFAEFKGIISTLRFLD